MDSLASIATLQSSIVDLERRANSLENFLYLFVLLVAVGVVVEVIVVLLDHHEAHRAYSPDVISSSKKPSWWKLLRELFGALLVAIGVAGELFVDVKSGGIQTQLRAKNGEVIQRLREISNTALLDAAAANERATANEREAQIAHRDTAQLQMTSKLLTNRNLVLQANVLTLQQRLAWRRLSPVQHQKIVAGLIKYAGSSVLIDVAGNGDPEALAFAGNISAVFKDGQWLQRIDQTGIRIPAPIGLICKVDDRSAAGKALIALLKDLPTATITLVKLEGFAAIITIGPRPPA